MGMSPDSSSPEDHKQKVAVGYPSMDQYNQAQYMFQAQPPLAGAVAYSMPYGPHGGYPTSSANPYPQPYAPSASYHFPMGYQNDPNYLASASQKPYVQPYNDFYYPQQHYKPLVPESNDSTSFGRVMLILMVVLIASMCMMTLVMWFLFGTYIPEFEVASLRVTNFMVTETALTGSWDVGLSVSNTNKDLAIRFDQVMSSIFYKEALLGISAVRSFDVSQMQWTEFNYTMPAEQLPGDNKLQGWVLPMLAQDRSNGMVVFSLRLALKANFTTTNMVYRQVHMKVMCENMQVMFSANGEGTLSPGLGNTCLLQINDGLKEY